MNPHSLIRNLGALLTLSLATACGSPELEEFPLQVEHSGSTVRFSWEGEKVHRFEITQCDNETPALDICSCNGFLVWGLGPDDSEKIHEVVQKDPFIGSPLEYGVTPAGDRKGYAARPLVSGKVYLVNASRFAPCEDNTESCALTVARGCQSFRQP